MKEQFAIVSCFITVLCIIFYFIFWLVPPQPKKVVTIKPINTTEIGAKTGRTIGRFTRGMVKGFKESNDGK
jgi:hypothetical protein